MYDKYLTIKPSKNGDGIFTSVQIPAKTAIIEPLGTIVTYKNLPDKNDNSILQIGTNYYMLKTGHLVPDHINHSCSPNCYFYIVGNRAILYSLFMIPANYELTFDYSTTSTEDKNSWQMTCNCGSFKCRKVISGYQYLDPNLQEEYKKQNILPLYITHNYMLDKE